MFPLCHGRSSHGTTPALEEVVHLLPLECMLGLGVCPEIHEGIQLYNSEATRSKTTGRCEGELKSSGVEGVMSRGSRVADVVGDCSN